MNLHSFLSTTPPSYTTRRKSYCSCLPFSARRSGTGARGGRRGRLARPQGALQAAGPRDTTIGACGPARRFSQSAAARWVLSLGLPLYFFPASLLDPGLTFSGKKPAKKRTPRKVPPKLHRTRASKKPLLQVALNFNNNARGQQTLFSKKFSTTPSSPI